ncbi:MAG: MarR family transcriptional regulator, partial [Rhodococcus sp. (in: high G+C Gram-positive bacteria)]
YAEEPVTAIRLAERLGMSRAGVSKALARLEKRGLVSRTSNPEDRRSALITMTIQGNAVVDDVFPRELAAHGELFTKLGRDRGKILAALEQLALSMEGGLDRTQDKK